MQVFGIDVGYGQVADKLRRDERVTVMERFNLRHLKPTDLPRPVRCVSVVQVACYWRIASLAQLSLDHPHTAFHSLITYCIQEMAVCFKVVT
jgi:hypothetical protein